MIENGSGPSKMSIWWILRLNLTWTQVTKGLQGQAATNVQWAFRSNVAVLGCLEHDRDSQWVWGLRFSASWTSSAKLWCNKKCKNIAGLVRHQTPSATPEVSGMCCCTIFQPYLACSWAPDPKLACPGQSRSPEGARMIVTDSSGWEG